MKTKQQTLKRRYRPLAVLIARYNKPPEFISNREIEEFLKDKKWLPGTPEYLTIKTYYKENVPFPRYVFTKLDREHPADKAA